MDPGKPLESIPRSNYFRETFLNPADVGGRYSALHPLGSFEDHRYACEEAELRIVVVDPAFEARADEIYGAVA